MKRAIPLILIVLIYNVYIKAQVSIENTLKTFLDARGASFSSYTGGYGLDMWNVRLFYSDSYPLTFTLIAPDKFRLSCGIVGRGNIDYFLDEFISDVKAHALTHKVKINI